MHCENYFCIYWRDNNCLLPEGISLDIRGSCQACIYINCSNRHFHKEREKILRRYRYADKMAQGR